MSRSKKNRNGPKGEQQLPFGGDEQAQNVPPAAAPVEKNPQSTPPPPAAPSMSDRLVARAKNISRKEKIGAAAFALLTLALGAFLIYKQPKIFSFAEAEREETFALVPTAPEFYHDQFVEYRFIVADPKIRKALLKLNPEMVVTTKEGQIVPTVGKVAKVALKPQEAKDDFLARWPVPWNAPDGEYQVRVDTTSFLPEWPKLKYKPFKIVSREFDPIPKGWGVLTLEDLNSLNNLTAPDGTKKDATALADWADFIGANAIVIQGAESGGYSAKQPDDKPWFTQSDKAIRTLGAECKKRGLKLGVYLLSFMCGGKPEFSPNYTYGWDYRGGELVYGLDMKTRRGISITDPKRVGDIVKMLKHWHDMPEVDIVGLDYIRPVFGGYELVDDFVREMPVEAPADFSKRTFKERMMWLAKSRILAPTLYMNELKNFSFIDRWFWYRAHRSAQIVRAIKSGLNPTKPLWAFTLSWEKGWQHGQDPVMFRDAGIDIDSIMLYEADSHQFRTLVNQWNEYVKASQVNLTMGDVIDWPLHQKTLNPAGPEDYINRNMMAVTGFHSDGPSRGLFVHDYRRAMRGRRGPYSSLEWMLAAGASITGLRDANNVLSHKLVLTVPETVRQGEAGAVTIAFADAKDAAKVKAKLYSPPDVELSTNEVELSADKPSVSVTARFQPGANTAARGSRSFVAVRTEPKDSHDRCQIYMKYFNGR